MMFCTGTKRFFYNMPSIDIRIVGILDSAIRKDMNVVIRRIRQSTQADKPGLDVAQCTPTILDKILVR